MLLAFLHACLHTPRGGAPSKPEVSGTFAVHLEVAGPTSVSMTVENTGASTGTFCTYHTPFEGILNDIFIVEQDERPLDYRGVLASRVPPGPEDHREIGPGAMEGPVTVDLRQAYGLESGTYSVRYRGTVISGLPDSNRVELNIP